MAVTFSGSKPAFEKLTDERRIENGSASTTRSAVTVFVPGVERQRVRAAGELDRDELVLELHSRAELRGEDLRIWSLPPRTWYFSFDGPKILNLPWPE